MAVDTIPARFLAQARVRPQAIAYGLKQGGQWQKVTWAAYVAEVRRAARALIQQRFQPGDKVAILGQNRPEWVMLDMAAMCAGGVAAGIYTTSSPSEVQYIVDHCEAAFVLVENTAQWEKIKAERQRLPRLRHVIFMRGAAVPNDPLAISWDGFLSLGDGVGDRVVDERVANLVKEQPATFIYTSGTTGPPKAVMLSHENIIWTASNAAEFVGLSEQDRVVSYLPLSHIAEQMFSVHGPAVCGASIHFAESLEKLREALVEVRPTVLFGVPRVWEKFYEGIRPRLEAATGVKAALAKWARNVGTEANRLKARNQPLPLALELQYKLAQRLIFTKLRAALGLDQTRIFVSGAAPITRDVLEFFASLDIVIQEVYGQSEDCGPTTFNRAGAIRFGTVGQPIPDVEVRIADDGEILVRGRNVFLGYYKEPAATAEALEDGWLHSGDLGTIDSEGFLHITGRKKEIIITAGGKNIAPNNIEEQLKGLPLVADAVVIGDRRKYLVALITLKQEEAQKFVEAKGAGGGPLHESPVIEAELKAGLERVNEELSRVETIRRFRVLPGNFSIDGGELTPTMKLKRKVIAHKYEREIESLYAAGEGQVGAA
jgi:long-chain acyl-CoA synthetase